MREAGIEVEVGVLQEEAQKLNERFIHNMLTERPFVVAKFAMTLDGKIATYNGHSQWITGEAARADVHELRHEVDGILVGVQTVLNDNPKLTTRLKDNRKGRNPIRVVLDSTLKTPVDADIADTTEARTIIVTSLDSDPVKAQQLERNDVEIIRVKKDLTGLNIEDMLKALYKKGITHLLIEGGGNVNASFLRGGFIDQYMVYVAPKVLGGKNSITPFTGSDVETIDLASELEFGEITRIGEDLRIIAYPKKAGLHE